jgi:hypothetical protein
MSYPAWGRRLLRIGGQIPCVYVGANLHFDIAANHAPHFSACSSHTGRQLRPLFQKRVMCVLLASHAILVDGLMLRTGRNRLFFRPTTAWQIDRRQRDDRQNKQRRHLHVLPLRQPNTAWPNSPTGQGPCARRRRSRSTRHCSHSRPSRSALHIAPTRNKAMTRLNSGRTPACFGRARASLVWGPQSNPPESQSCGRACERGESLRPSPALFFQRAFRRRTYASSLGRFPRAAFSF